MLEFDWDSYDLKPGDLQARAHPTPEAAPKLLSTLDDVKLWHVQRVLAHVHGNQSKAAAILGISRRSLYRLPLLPL